MRAPQLRPRPPRRAAALVLLLSLLLAARAAPDLLSAAPLPAIPSLESLVPTGFASAAAKAISGYASVFQDARDRLNDATSSDLFNSLASGTSSLRDTALAGLISLSVHEICPIVK